MQVRAFQMADFAAVVALWKEAGLLLSRSDSKDGLERKLDRDPDLFLVAEHEDEIVGAVMGSYDGRRGWVNHLAVLPTCQGQRLGSLLMAELERRFREIGCTKVNLLIEPTNAQVEAFYRAHGYRVDDLIFMEKWLD